MFAVPPPGTGPPPTGPPATLPPGTGLFQYMKTPMENWTKSTFYSATANEVSNGKMDKVHILATISRKFVLRNLFL